MFVVSAKHATTWRDETTGEISFFFSCSSSPLCSSLEKGNFVGVSEMKWFARSEGFLKLKRVLRVEGVFFFIGFWHFLLLDYREEGCLGNGIFNSCYVLFVFIRHFYLLDKNQRWNQFLVYCLRVFFFFFFGKPRFRQVY